MNISRRNDKIDIIYMKGVISMLGGIIGGTLGLIGVILSVVFSYKLNKSNQQFQLELKDKEHAFELKLKNIEKENSVWLKKYSLLIQLMSHKHDIGSQEFGSALNGVVALFHDSKTVMDALKSFYSIAAKPKEQKSSNEQNEKLIEVFYAIYSELEMNEELDKNFLEKTFQIQKEPLSLFEVQQLITLARIADATDSDPDRKQLLKDQHGYYMRFL